MTLNTITDYDIQALVDDELNHEDAKNVRAYIEKDPKANERYNELLEQKNILKKWWQSYKQRVS